MLTRYGHESTYTIWISPVIMAGGVHITVKSVMLPEKASTCVTESLAAVHWTNLEAPDG